MTKQAKASTVELPSADSRPPQLKDKNEEVPAARTRLIQKIDIGAKVFDVLFKAIIAIVATWWAIRSFGLQQDRTDKNVRAQLETQREAARSQREMQEATLIASVIGRLKCQGTEEEQLQQLMALKLVREAAPTFSASLSEVLLGCAKAPIDREIIEQFRNQSSMRELATRFLSLLADARQSRRFGLNDQVALDEFEKARSAMPKSYEIFFDSQEFDDAHRARLDHKYEEASDHYERAFRRIDTNDGVNALPPSVPTAK